jgi:uroporphyrinogen-III synthase
MRVLLTRAREASEKSARRLARAGHETLILPLMRYRDTSEPVPAGVHEAIAFTSAEAAHSLGRRIAANPALRDLKTLPAFCVGEATAGASRKAGFANTISAGGDAAALAGMISASAPQGLSILYPTQPNRSLDLAAALPRCRIAEFIAYEAEMLDPGGAVFAAAISACDSAFLYSPRSAGHFADLLRAHASPAALQRLTLIAISEKTARAITTGHADWAKEAGFGVAIAASPDEDAMVSLLGGGTGGSTA